MKLTIRTKDVELTPDIQKYVDEKIGTLDKYYGRIVDGFVELEKSTNHHKSGPIFRAASDLRLPNKVVRAAKNHVDLRAAIDGIKDELKTQLIDYKEMIEAREKKEGLAAKEASLSEGESL